jgi:Ca2+-binding EF-hand superfamily protein
LCPSQLHKQQISAIFDRADTNKDGKIEFDEFLKLLSLNALQVQAVAGQAKR